MKKTYFTLIVQDPYFPSSFVFNWDYFIEMPPIYLARKALIGTGPFSSAKADAPLTLLNTDSKANGRFGVFTVRLKRPV